MIGLTAMSCSRQPAALPLPVQPCKPCTPRYPQVLLENRSRVFYFHGEDETVQIRAPARQPLADANAAPVAAAAGQQMQGCIACSWAALLDISCAGNGLLTFVGPILPQVPSQPQRARRLRRPHLLHLRRAPCAPPSLRQLRHRRRRCQPRPPRLQQHPPALPCRQRCRMPSRRACS